MGGTAAPRGPFPYFVAVLTTNGTYRAGALLNSEYILTQDEYEGEKIAFGLNEGQSFEDLFSSSNPKTRNVVDNVYVPSSNLLMMRVSPPIDFDWSVRPIKFTDCSGASEPIVDEDLVYFGLGDNGLQNYSDTLQMKCGQVVEPTDSDCTDDVAQFSVSNHFCVQSEACSGDWGGPLATMEDGEFVLVGIIYLAYRAACDSKL